MRAGGPTRRDRIFALALLAVAAGCGGEPDAPPSPLVDDAVVEQALGLAHADRLQLSDEIRFFEARLDGGARDALALRRIHGASVLRARAYGRAEDAQRAESTLRLLRALHRDDAWVWSARAALDLSSHRFQAAVAAAESALEVADGSDATEPARLRLFDAYMAAGRFDDAEAQLQLVRDRSGIQALVREARLLDRRGLVDRARDRLYATVRLAEAYAEPGLVQAWARVELGHLEHHSGHPDRAVERYLEALAVAPGYGAAFEGLAQISYAVDGDLAKAERLYNRAIVSGGHLDLYLPLMEIARARGDGHGAREYRERFLTEATESEEAEALFRRPLSLVLAEGGDEEFERAMAYARADMSERRTPETLAVYAWLLHRSGAVDAAALLFHRALEWGVPEPLVFELAGQAAVDRGDVDQGRELLGRALEAEFEIGPVRARRIRAVLSGAGRSLRS